MNVLSISRQRALASATVGIIGLTFAGQALAVSSAFSPTPADNNYNNAANWVTGIPNGTGDTATFNTPISNTIGSLANPITLSAAVALQNLTFDTANVGAYQIGAAGGLGITFRGTGTASGGAFATFGNSVSLTATVANPQVVATPITFSLPGSVSIGYAFNNNATNAAATLTISGAITTATSTNRFTSLQLGGSNTGLNTVSGVITSGMGTTSAGQGNVVLNKVGLGTWILSGANVFTGTGITTVAQGVNVNGGILGAYNNNAFGTSGTANANQVNVNNTGTVQIGGGITLDNGVSLNLNSGGGVQSNGTSTINGRINVTTAAASTGTISTVSASDVFTVGNAANDFTGGSATSDINFTGPGTIVLGQASNYAGGVTLSSGTIQVGNATALGAAATASVTFAPSSTAVLQVGGGVNSTVAGLQGTAGAGFVEAAAGGGTLTVGNANANQYGGTLRDGAGQLSLTKNGAGVLALTGNNTFTGNVAVNNGSLLANNTAGSATGTGNTVTVSGTGIVGGNGTIGGNVVLAGGSTARLAPGGAAGQVGTLTVGGLTLNTNTVLDYDITNSTTLDRVNVTGGNGLVINGGTLSINGGTSTFTANGVYNLIGYTGGIGGTGVSALALDSANKSLATNSYTFGSAGGFVTLTVASTGGTISYYNVDADSNYSAPGAFTPSQPNGVGAFASFGGGGTAITANRTITVDAAKTLGTISFNQPNGFRYTLAGANTITLNNGVGNSAFISDTAGSHTINAPLALTSGGVTVTVGQAADTLGIGGAISGAGAVSKTGVGALALTGNNSYAGGTTLGGGTVLINSASSLGDASGNATFAGGTLGLLADVTTTRSYVTDPNGAPVRINTNGFNLVQNGTVLAGSNAAGGLTKSGLGALTLAGVNTYTGPTSVTGGTLNVAANNNLGDPVSGAALNLSGGATLQTTSTVALENAGANLRPVNIGTGGAVIAPAAGTTLTVNGLISGADPIAFSGAGTTLLTGNNFTTLTGPVTINSGTITLGGGIIANQNNAIGAGTITLNGGTLNLNGSFAQDPNGGGASLPNNLVVPAGQTATLATPARGSLNGSLTGSGTLNYFATYVRGQIGGNWSAFTGTINFLPEVYTLVDPTGVNPPQNFTTGDIRQATLNGFPNARLNITAGTNLYVSLAFGPPATNTPGQAIPIGEISGNGNIAGGPTGGRLVNYLIGGLNTNSTYTGFISNSGGATSITKTGTGTLTLTGANAYSGVTSLAGGTLNINGINALGGANYGFATTGLAAPYTNVGLYFNGGTLQYASPSAGGLTSSGDITADAGGVARNVSFAQTAVIDTNGNNVTYANSLGNAGIGGLTKAGAGTLTLNAASTYTGATTITGGRLRVTSNGSVGTLLTGPATAGVNLANGALVVDYSTDGNGSPAATIRGLLAASFQDPATPGVMDTGTLRSSTATDKRGIGYRDNATLADGPSNTVTVQATLFGDADLDNGVSINDFNALAGNFGKPSGQVWAGGDFDYDGGVSINDFNLLAGNFGQTLAAAGEGPNPLALALWSFAVANHDEAGFIAATGVPEPTTLGLLAAGATLALRRRRAC